MATQERQVLRGLGEIILALPRFATAPLIRRRHLRWGATDAEVAAPMPGDELVPRSSFTATRAITINAPPDAVWPWLVQLGYRRAGWYTYDLFDNASYPSADRILPEHQNLKVGDRVPMAKNVNDTTAFWVVGMEPNRWLLWQKPNSTWAWKLVPLGGGRTRLITRLKALYAWRTSPGNALLTLILFEFGDFPMTRKLLLGVKRRAEHLVKDADRTANGTERKEAQDVTAFRGQCSTPRGTTRRASDQRRVICPSRPTNGARSPMLSEDSRSPNPAADTGAATQTERGARRKPVERREVAT